MTDNKKSIYTEIAALTKDNPENYLVSSLTGKLGLRGKFIKDENGKLIPVLLNIKNPKSLPISHWGIITDTSSAPKREELKTTWFRKAFQKSCGLLGLKISTEQETPSFALKVRPVPAQPSTLED